MSRARGQKEFLQSEQKLLQKEQKCLRTKFFPKSNKKSFKGNRKHSGMKIAPNWMDNLNVFVAYHGLVQPSMALCDLLWSCIAISLLFHIAFYGLLWSFNGISMVLYGKIKYWFYWTCIVISCGHRSKLIWSCSVNDWYVLKWKYQHKVGLGCWNSSNPWEIYSSIRRSKSYDVLQKILSYQFEM